MTRSLALLILAGVALHAQLKPGKVEMTAVNSVTGTPAANVDVEISKVGGSYITRATSDDNGVARFGRVEPGVYRITGTNAAGFSFDAPANTSTISVRENETTQGGKVIVTPHGSISGRVRDENGDPVKDAEVTAAQYGYMLGSRVLWQTGITKTDAEGRYRIENLPSQQYAVKFRITKDFEWIGGGYYPNADSATQALRVPVSPGIETPAIDFRLRPAEKFHIRGTLDGVSSGEIKVASCPDGPWDGEEFYKLAFLRQDGSFDVGGISNGRYCLRYEEARTLGPGKFERLLTAREVVVVKDEDAGGVRMKALPPAMLDGIVKAEAGVVVGLLGQVMFKELAAPDQIMPKIDAQGKFQLALKPGEGYRLHVYPVGAYVKSAKVGGQEIRDGIFRADGDAPIEIVLAVGYGGVKGHVTFGSRMPAPTFVTLAGTGDSSRRSDLLRTIQSDGAGNFEVGGLAPGVYKVIAWEKYDRDLVRMTDFLELFPGVTVRVPDGPGPTMEVPLTSAREFEEARARF